MRIVVTGGAGYIGSQLANRLQSLGHSILVFDNLSNGRQSCLHSQIQFKPRDIVTEKQTLREELGVFQPDAVIHCAALADVEQSLHESQKYYDTNTGGTQNIAEIAAELGVERFIFSSTAAVYGSVQTEKISETQTCKPINPYGQSKLEAEKILENLTRRADMAVTCLRYFNVVGFAQEAQAGARSASTALFPKVVRSLKAQDKEFTIYGSDYETADGTCVRDFIHIEDLISAHIELLKLSNKAQAERLLCCNCGSGQGASVKQVLGQFNSLTGHKLQIHYGERRQHDTSVAVADIRRLTGLIAWKPLRSSLPEMCRSELAFAGL